MDFTPMKTTAPSSMKHQHQKGGPHEDSWTNNPISCPTSRSATGFFVVWGIAVGLLSTTDSLTRFIPCVLGAGLVVSGGLAKSNPEQRKLWMHVAVVLGLLSALLGTRFFMVMGDGRLRQRLHADVVLHGSAYTALCVRSFIQARKASE